MLLIELYKKNYLYFRFWRNIEENLGWSCYFLPHTATWSLKEQIKTWKCNKQCPLNELRNSSVCVTCHYDLRKTACGGVALCSRAKTQFYTNFFTSFRLAVRSWVPEISVRRHCKAEYCGAEHNDYSKD